MAGPGDILDSLGEPVYEDEYYPVAEDFVPSPPKPQSPLSRTPPIDALRPALLMFVLFWVASGYAWKYPDSGGYASGERVLEHGEAWRLLTALFTHADAGHLFSNTPLFLIFGWYLYAFFGPLAFPGAALVVGVLSNLATIATYDPQAELVGASGMLYGMIALWLVLYVRFESAYTVPMRIFRSVGVALLLLFPTTFQESTSYMAHAAGFAIGLVVGFALTPFVHIHEVPARVDQSGRSSA
jgi:rhomboid protease GluP